jgi:ligand-binding sensor domain-containing protein/two-component sensor histidine kinase
MKYAFLYLLSLLCTIKSYSQSYSFRPFTVKNGLQNDEILDIIQDNTNAVWISTNTGISKFDGKNFISDFKQKALNNLSVRSMHADKNSGVYFSTWFNGIVRLENNKCDTFTDKNVLFSNRLNTVRTDTIGRTWVINKLGIVILKDNQVVKKISFKTLNLRFKNISGLYIHPNNHEIWASSTSEGILNLDINTLKYTIYKESDGIGNNIVYSVHKIGDKLYFGNYGGFAVYEKNRFTDYQLPGNFDDNRVFNIERYEPNRLVLSTESNGIFFINEKKAITAHWTMEQGLASNYIRKVLVDKEKNLLIATLDKGLQILSEKALRLYSNKQYFNTQMVTSLFRTPEGVFAETEDGALHDIRFQSDSFYISRVLHYPLLKNNLINAVRYENGTSYMATNRGIVSIKNNKDEKIQIENDQNFITAISELNANGNRYIASDAYSFKFDGTDFSKLFIDSSIPAMSAHDYQIDPYNISWVAATEGLFYIQNDTPHLFPTKSKTSLLAKIIKEDNKLWISGVLKNYLLVPEKNIKSSHIIEMSLAKLLNKKKEQLLDVFDHTMVWLIEERIVLINTNDFINNNISNIKTVFSFRDICDGNVNYNNIVVKDGRLIIATNEGIVAVKLDEIKNNSVPPNIELNQIYLFSDALPDIYNTSKTAYDLVLPHNKNYLSFDFTLISFKYPEESHLMYRLSGQDTNWYESNNNKVVLSYITPGEYKLQLKAKNCDGVISQQLLEIPIKIKFPFWRTYWFYFSCFASCSTIAYLIFKSKLNKLKAEALIQQKISGMIINSQENERKRISKDLHDSVGQNLLAIKNNIKTNNTENTLELVDTTINEIREISRNLHPYQIDKIGITKTILNTFMQLETHNIFVSEDVENFDKKISPENEVNLYRIVQEICNNIIKHSGANAANISTTIVSDLLILQIKDNGKGFNLEQNKENVLKSFGLSSIQERIKIMHAALDITSEPNKGTYIKITSPTEVKYENN